MSDRPECPMKRCCGRLSDPDALGTDQHGRHVEWRTCDRCGRPFELEVAPVDHPELDLGGDA